jgi:hypothetical protein
MKRGCRTKHQTQAADQVREDQDAGRREELPGCRSDDKGFQQAEQDEHPAATAEGWSVWMTMRLEPILRLVRFHGQSYDDTDEDAMTAAAQPPNKRTESFPRPLIMADLISGFMSASRLSDRTGRPAGR